MSADFDPMRKHIRTKDALTKPLRWPPMCDECGVNRSDPPSKLCPGCQAYREYQQ